MELRLERLVPKDALNVETREVSEEGARASQLAFAQYAKLRAPPLNETALQRLKNEGWRLCDSPLSK